MSEYSVLGRRLPRVDGPVKATGQAHFTDDLAVPGMLHGKILRSPHAHARILDIDTVAARRLPGVRGVIVGTDFGDFRYGLRADTRDEYPLAREKVRYVGEEVAAVAAVDEDTAHEALSLIRVDYEVLPAVIDPEEALREGAPQLHDDKPGNISVHMKTAFGDVDEAFRRGRLHPRGPLLQPVGVARLPGAQRDPGHLGGAQPHHDLGLEAEPVLPLSQSGQLLSTCR